jgi:pilus assembly protein Flp/PilA
MMLLACTSRAPEASQRGQGLVEYALILVLVAIVVLAALMILGPVIGGAFSTINNSLISI